MYGVMLRLRTRNSRETLKVYYQIYVQKFLKGFAEFFKMLNSPQVEYQSHDLFLIEYKLCIVKIKYILTRSSTNTLRVARKFEIFFMNSCMP